MSYASSYLQAVSMMITMTCRQTFHRLTEANLSRHNESHGESQAAANEEKQTMKCFRKDEDPYRRFLVTGGSPHQQGDQQESKQGKFPDSLCDVVSYGIK